MEFRDVIQKRHSIRAFLDKPISEDKLQRVLEAARLAPSASNRQPWKFVVVKDAEKKRALAQAANNQAFVGQAPVIIAAVALDPGRIMTCEVPTYAVDLAIAMEQVVLAAADEGLGTCWIGSFSQEGVKRVLSIPDKYKVVTVMPVGYPSGEATVRPKKSLEEIICYDRFSE